jgi:hypothetical protein
VITVIVLSIRPRLPPARRPIGVGITAALFRIDPMKPGMSTKAIFNDLSDTLAKISGAF